MSSPRTPTTTTSAATTTPNATPNEPYDASPATPTAWATPSASTPSKPPNSPNAASLTAIFDAGFLAPSGAAAEAGKWGYGRPGRRSHCDAYELVTQDGAGDHRQELSIVA